MARVSLAFVPPGGGQTDYSIEAELPGVPAAGDYLVFHRPDEEGTSDFIVRRVWWRIGGDVDGVTVECEFALGRTSSEGHRQACEAYRQRGMPLRQFEEIE
jgi:hypothetical protein